MHDHWVFISDCVARYIYILNTETLKAVLSRIWIEALVIHCYTRPYV